MPTGTDEPRELEVLERVREIPAGFVRTYGDVSPGAPRFAGAVLFECDDPDLPWWRVVRADGSLAKGARKAGFRPVGVMRQSGRDAGGSGWHDNLLMELLAEHL